MDARHIPARCLAWPSLILLGLAVSPLPAHASGFDVFGMGARGSAMVSASVSTADDFSAVYYNPAGMLRSKSMAGIGLMVSFDNASIVLSPRPDGYDIPDLGVNTPAIPSAYRLRPRRNTQGLDSLFAVVVGGITDLGIDRLRLGVAALIPVANEPATASVYNDEREQYFSNQLHFDLLGNRLHHQIILVAAAYQVLDWLSIGAGLSFMPNAETRNAVLIPDVTDQSHYEIDVATDLKSRFRPSFGILVAPPGRVRGGVAFRDEQLFALTGRTEVQLRGFQGQDTFPFYQDLDLTLQYSPRQLVLGGSWEGDRVLLSLDVIYSLWSDFLDNHSQEVDFSDTFSPRLGAELRLSDHHHLRLGLGYDPTPVPPQTGRSNYVDNSRIMAAVGMEHEIEILGMALRVSWFVQFHFLLARDNVKAAQASYPSCAPGVTQLCDELPDDSVNPATGEVWPEAAGLQTGNPGFPGFASGGWIGAAGLEVAWEF